MEQKAARHTRTYLTTGSVFPSEFKKNPVYQNFGTSNPKSNILTNGFPNLASLFLFKRLAFRIQEKPQSKILNITKVPFAFQQSRTSLPNMLFCLNQNIPQM